MPTHSCPRRLSNCLLCGNFEIWTDSGSTSQPSRQQDLLPAASTTKPLPDPPCQTRRGGRWQHGFGVPHAHRPRCPPHRRHQHPPAAETQAARGYPGPAAALQRGRPGSTGHTHTSEHPLHLTDASFPRHHLLSHFAFCSFVCHNPHRVTLPTTQRRKLLNSKLL